jgi:hypothetical protein
MTELDLQPKSDRELLMLAVVTLNNLDSKFEKACITLDKHDVQINDYGLRLTKIETICTQQHGAGGMGEGCETSAGMSGKRKAAIWGGSVSGIALVIYGIVEAILSHQ